MATSVVIGGHGTLFVGEDKIFRLECLDQDPPGGVPVNMADWVVLFEIRASDYAAAALISVPATIVGDYAITRLTNTQRAEAGVTDTQTGALLAGHYRYSWKRLDADRETLLSYGSVIVERATQI